MIRIVTNHNKQEVTYSFYEGQQIFPSIQGKLLFVEVTGRELTKLMDLKEIPICAVVNSVLAWHGKQAGGILKMLREMFDK